MHISSASYPLNYSCFYHICTCAHKYKRYCALASCISATQMHFVSGSAGRLALVAICKCTQPPKANLFAISCRQRFPECVLGECLPKGVCCAFRPPKFNYSCNHRRQEERRRKQSAVVVFARHKHKPKKNLERRILFHLRSTPGPNTPLSTMVQTAVNKTDPMML
jgi:hypothetical protein